MYQAWVALSAGPVADYVRHVAAEGLARNFTGVSPDSAAQGFGRLAGFTFGEEKRDPPVKRRFALVHGGLLSVSSNGPTLLDQIKSTLREQLHERERKRSSSDEQLRRNPGRGLEY